MVAWDIRYSSAMGVVNTTLTEADKYETTDVVALRSALEAAEAALTRSGPVAPAVFDYVENDAGKQLDGVFGHTNSAIQGTNDALNAYAQGQYDMAATAQRNASAAHYPDDMPGGRVPQR